MFCFLNICEKRPLIRKNCIQSLKNRFFVAIFPIFTKGIQTKLNDLDSERKTFLKMRGKVGKSECDIATSPQCIVGETSQCKIINEPQPSSMILDDPESNTMNDTIIQRVMKNI